MVLAIGAGADDHGLGGQHCEDEQQYQDYTALFHSESPIWTELGCSFCA